MDEEIAELDEDLLILELHAVYQGDVDVPLLLSVSEDELDALLWLDVPDPAGTDVAGLVLSVAYPL